MNPLSPPSIKLDKYILTYTINMNFDKKQTWCNNVPRLIHPLEWPHCLLQPDPLTGVSLLSQWSQFLWTLGCTLSARFTPVTCEMRCTRLALFPSFLLSPALTGVFFSFGMYQTDSRGSAIGTVKGSAGYRPRTSSSQSGRSLSNSVLSSCPSVVFMVQCGYLHTIKNRLGCNVSQ